MILEALILLSDNLWMATQAFDLVQIWQIFACHCYYLIWQISKRLRMDDAFYWTEFCGVLERYCCHYWTITLALLNWINLGTEKKVTILAAALNETQDISQHWMLQPDDMNLNCLHLCLCWDPWICHHLNPFLANYKLVSCSLHCGLLSHSH